MNSEFSDGFKLWVDAICINQDDLDERGRQVRRMREIYSTAWTVVAWLGEEHNQSHKAVQLIHDLAGFNERNEGQRLEKRLREDPTVLGKGNWLALQEFMDRVYWYRLWILQELIMGASAVIIRCGSSSIDWETFCNGVTLLEEDLWQVKDGLLTWDINTQGLRTKETAWSTASLHLVYQDLSTLSQFEEPEADRSYLSFGRILDIANWAECLDPRDKVYGLVGLMKPNIAQQIIPDYTLHPMSVYANATKLFILSSGSLDPIREGNPWGPARTPSWVADWEWEGRARMARTESQLWGPSWLSSKSKPMTDVPYQASGTHSGEFLFSSDGLLLTCTGLVIDSISGLSARGEGYFAWSKASIHQPDPWKSIYGDKTATSEALYHTIVADRVSGGIKRMTDTLSYFTYLQYLPKPDHNLPN
jgi:hypothetical protein